MAQSGVGSTVRALIETARTEQLGFLAAAIAYYAFVSLIPLLLLALAVATTVAGEAFAARVLGVAGTVLSPAAIGLLDSALSSGAGRGGATLAGLVVLGWSGLRVFRGLDLAFARIYRTEEQSSLVTNLADAAVALAAIGAAVGAVVVATAVLPRFGIRAQSPAGALVLTAVLPVVFLPLYYVFPDCPVTLREVLPGAALAGFGWTALGVVFGIYATGAASFQLYGVIGGVLVVLTWFYFGGLLLLSGAVLNTVLAGRRDRQLQQGPLRDPYRAMHESDGSEGDGASARRTDTDATAAGDTGGGVSEPVDQEDIAQLRRDLDRFEAEIEDRTVHRDELEADLQRYVRRRQRRGHARGWGPYLVLLYGTVMSLGAFFFLDGVWAVLALLFVWLSTLGLYTLMVLVGLTFTVAGLPGRLRDAVSGFRD